MTGLTLPVQARINGELGVRLNDGVLAGIVSFCASIVVIGVALFCTRAGRAAFGSLAAGTRNRSFPLYLHFAGLIAAYFVLGMTYFAVVVGLAVYTVASVTGQTLSALILDRAGFGPGEKRPITPARLVAAVLTVAAVIYAVWPRISAAQDVIPMLLPVGFVVLAGILISVQQAMNGVLAVHAKSPLPGTFANYVVGSLVLAVGWLVKFSFDGLTPRFPSEPWLYIGGVLGCLNLLMSAVLLRRIGALLTGLGLIAGQLVGSLLVDLLLPVSGSVIHAETLLGTALTLVAIVLAAKPTPSVRKKLLRPHT